MSYQVIARKYRPQTFADLTGQEHITRTLSQALDQNRLHHAYLFSGVRGTGKTTSARILAKGLNCHTGITSRPCLRCPSCTEIAAGNALDVLEIDAASNTGVDNVRDVIINNIAMLPARDRFKVFVIDEVHMLSNSAFNALLKTLEEPPAHVIFIMATTELHKLPDTILSRCQQFEFRQIPTEKIFSRLREIADQEEIKIGDAQLREVARSGAGSLRDAQSALDQVIAFSGDEITEEDVTASLGLVSVATLGRCTEAIAARQTATLLNLIEEVGTRGYDLRNFTRELMAYLRHLLLVKSGITDDAVLGVTDVEIERLKQLATQFSEEDLVRCFHLLAETEKEIKDAPHPRFQLEVGLVKLTHAIRLRSLDDLIARLESLATGPSSNSPSPETRSSRATSLNNLAEKTVPANVDPSNVATGAPRQSPINQSNLRVTASAPAPAPASPDADLPVEPEWLARSFDPDTRDSMEPPQVSAHTVSQQSSPASNNVIPGQEKEAILAELERLNRPLVQIALEEAQEVSYSDNSLMLVFGSDNTFAKRIRESGSLFRDIGQRLWGRPIQIEVKISEHQGEKPPDENELKRRALYERAQQDPGVKLFLEIIKGEILWVKEKAEVEAERAAIAARRPPVKPARTMWSKMPPPELELMKKEPTPTQPTQPKLP